MIVLRRRREQQRRRPLLPDRLPVVAVLVGAYVLIGTPGLHRQVANAPAGQKKVDVTVQQPAAPAPATPAPATRRPSVANRG